MWQKLARKIKNIDDIKIAILATLVPISLMIIWQMENESLPFADANDFIGTAGIISNFFLNGNILEGLWELFSAKPWRPVSFHLILFPFMLISKNNILFTAACVHSLCLFFIITYSYYIFRKLSECKFSCFICAVFIGLLPYSFFPGGDYMLFAETALTPAVLAVIYHLYSSDYMRIKSHSFYSLIAMIIAFTIRPIEAITHLLPLLVFFIYLGYKNKVFSASLILNIIKVILVALLILFMRGLDLDIDHRIVKINNPNSADLYELALKFIIAISFIFFIPSILLKLKQFYKFVYSSRKVNNNSYALIIFTILSFSILIWFFDSWRDLYSWIYRTQFGDIAKGTVVHSSYLQIPMSINELWAKIHTQLAHGGFLPYIVILISSIIAFVSRLKNNIKKNKTIYLYLFYSIIFAALPVLITIQDTPRKFTLSYIVILIIGIIYILSAKKIKNIFIAVITSVVILQSISIYKIANSTELKQFSFISGNLKKPGKSPMEPKIIKLIYENSKKYKFKNVELTYLYPDITHDIFTSAMIDALIPTKSYFTKLPVVFENYNTEWLTERIKHSDAMFIINPYGSLDESKLFEEKFFNEIGKSDLAQYKFYSELMYLYFSKKLSKNHGYIVVECMDLSKNNKTQEGCLLINRNSVQIKQ